MPYLSAVIPPSKDKTDARTNAPPVNRCNGMKAM